MTSKELAATMTDAASRVILREVLDVMQDADELGGPEPEGYVELMRAIAKEASARADVCESNDPILKDKRLHGRCANCDTLATWVHEPEYGVTDDGRSAVTVTAKCENRDCGEMWVEVYVIDHIEEV